MPQSVPPSATVRLDPWRVRLRRFRDDMRTEGLIFADEAIWRPIRGDLTLSQVADVATLPGIVGPSMAMPDAHQGYGFPIGGVAATDALGDGVVSPGGVGFDINCGVRLLATDVPLDAAALSRVDDLVDALYMRVPVGLGRKGEAQGMDGVLSEGAAWIAALGMGTGEDLARTEEGGRHPLADPGSVSPRARERGECQVGTLGSGNHFVEVQRVGEILDEEAASAFGLWRGQMVVLVHTGSRGLGHQVCTDAVKEFGKAMARLDIRVPDRQLACAPVRSDEGRRYLGAMGAAANFAWANRQAITHAVRAAVGAVYGGAAVRVVYDVAHNLAKLEDHEWDGRRMHLCVHRKGATRAFPPGHADLPPDLRVAGQPVFIPGSMGTASYVLAGTDAAMAETWGSVCHGAGRAMSRTAARKAVTGKDVLADLSAKGVRVRAGSKAGLAEEFPGAYKDVSAVVGVVAGAGLARVVARLVPVGVVKG